MADGLNPEQREAVQTLQGPLLVLAGAGSGKTRVVTFRIAELIRHGTKPSRILGVTFTNKAAAEMQERIRARLPGRVADKPRICTFHAHALDILRRHIDKLGYPRQFTIYDRSDQEGLVRRVMKDVRVTDAMLRPNDFLYLVGQWKTRSIRPKEALTVAQSDKEHAAAMVYRHYQRALQLAGAVDFDDLLLCTEELFERFADVRREEAARFDQLLVDEYQDTNASQYRLIRGLAADHRNLCVVGDDDQSIYGWRGADVEHILRFARDWPDARVVRLEQNYRSTAAILEAANRLIAYNSRRHGKQLRAARAGGDRPRILQFRDETAEAKGIVADLQARIAERQWEPRDFAVLFRTNEQPRAFEVELRKAQLPYVVVGSQSFFDRREVRDILAYLRLIESPRDEIALRRVINTPARGIGARTVEVLCAAALAAQVPLWEVLEHRLSDVALTLAARQAVSRFVALIERFHREYRQTDRNRSLAALAQALIHEIDYEAELRHNYPEPKDQQARGEFVQEVVNALAAYERESTAPELAVFLRESALGEREFDDQKEKQLQRNAVVLMTLHSAKGLEFPHVYMVGMEEGILPHKHSLASDTIDEERRLCYVGMTRAQDRLTLSLALTRLKRGQPRETVPSRFLFEITGAADKAPRR